MKQLVSCCGSKSLPRTRILISEYFAEEFQKTLHSILFLDVSSTRCATSDLIQGPQATVRYDEATCELLWEQNPSSNQVCLVSEDFAEEFQKTLHSILFLDVSST